jgi:hypothetical protein
MSETTVHFDGYYVDCEVSHFIPYIPVRWGPTPEDSDDSEEAQLEFNVIKVVNTSKEKHELPTLDEIHAQLLVVLH